MHCILAPTRCLQSTCDVQETSQTLSPGAFELWAQSCSVARQELVRQALLLQEQRTRRQSALSGTALSMYTPVGNAGPTELALSWRQAGVQGRDASLKDAAHEIRGHLLDCCLCGISAVLMQKGSARSLVRTEVGSSDVRGFSMQEHQSSLSADAAHQVPALFLDALDAAHRK